MNVKITAGQFVASAEVQLGSEKTIVYLPEPIVKQIEAEKRLVKLGYKYEIAFVSVANILRKALLEKLDIVYEGNRYKMSEIVIDQNKQEVKVKDVVLWSNFKEPTDISTIDVHGNKVDYDMKNKKAVVMLNEVNPTTSILGKLRSPCTQILRVIFEAVKESLIQKEEYAMKQVTVGRITKLDEQERRKDRDAWSHATIDLYESRILLQGVLYG